MMPTVQWTKVITDPLGIAGYALALVFSIVSRSFSQRRSKRAKWILPAAYALATACALGGLFLAYRRQSLLELTPPPGTTTSPVVSPSNSMHVDTIQQKVSNGSAIAGVQGNIAVAPSESSKKPTPPK